MNFHACLPEGTVALVRALKTFKVWPFYSAAVSAVISAAAYLLPESNTWINLTNSWDVKSLPSKNQNLVPQHPETSAAQYSSSEPACMSLCFWETSWGGHSDQPESTEATTAALEQTKNGEKQHRGIQCSNKQKQLWPSGIWFSWSLTVVLNVEQCNSNLSNSTLTLTQW